MKRVFNSNSSIISPLGDSGDIAIAEGNACKILDAEQNVINTIPVQAPIRFLNGSPFLTVGINGSIFLLNSDKNLNQYLFPSEYATYPPSCIAFSEDYSLVAIGVSNIILVYDLKKPVEKSLNSLLQGHDTNVIQLTFLFKDGFENFLVSCGSDSRFHCWDIKKRSHVYESPFESNFSIVGVHAFYNQVYFVIIFSDGYAKIYDPTPMIEGKPSVKFLKVINLTRIDVDMGEEEEQSIVISKYKTPKPVSDFKPEIGHEIFSTGFYMIQNFSFILCSTPNSIISLNVANYEKSVPYFFEQLIQWAIFDSNVVIAKYESSNQFVMKKVVLGFLPEVGVSFFVDSPLPDNSPLLLQKEQKTKSAVPIATLHKNVKPSGYSKPKEPLKKGVKPKQPKPKEELPLISSFSPPTKLFATLTPHDQPIFTASISSDGNRTISVDNQGTIVFIKKGSKNYPSFLGHSQPVTDLSWSKDKFFLSSSLDRTIRVWSIEKPDPFLILSKVKSSEGKKDITEPIQSSSFFWEDKFILSAYGSTVGLYSYQLPNVNSKNIQDMHKSGSYLLTKSVGIESGKIVSMACSNFPTSPIVGLITTTKKISIIDFSTGQISLEFDTLHEKAVSSIRGNFGGIYTPRTSMIDYFLTGALDESFKLWDLRSVQCSRTFVCGSRVKKVGSCFSPCSRFVALGTERFGIEIWDIGTGLCVQKFKEEFRGTSVTWMDWNPLTGRIHCGLENGQMKVLGGGDSN